MFLHEFDFIFFIHNMHVEIWASKKCHCTWTCTPKFPESAKKWINLHVLITKCYFKKCNILNHLQFISPLLKLVHHNISWMVIIYVIYDPEQKLRNFQQKEFWICILLFIWRQRFNLWPLDVPKLMWRW